jgi:cysteinyl-tRNA synthetase
MTIRVYNTISGKKEDFVPLEDKTVRMYVCGPTVYDSSHIGHARSVVVFDVVVRYLRNAGFTVHYIRNFTDVDDKIIKRAEETGMDSRKLADKYIDEFYDDMDALNVMRADVEPLATQHIGDMIALIERLMEKGHAYAVGGDVFFSVESFAEYGKLSGRDPADMMAGARVSVDERKKNPLDFALWKTAKAGEPEWDSPWGKGRPGWHIECSAMNWKRLGETIDIHGGGKDLIFPHHENEIAQSEAAFEKPFAKYWMHNGFVNIDQEKMSKSLGNFLMVKDIRAKADPEAIRLFLLSRHYRSPIDFTDQALAEAESGIDRFYSLLQRVEPLTGPWTDILPDDSESPEISEFRAAMDDDFNTARAIAVLYETVRRFNRLMDESSEAPAGTERENLRSGMGGLRWMADVLGLLQRSPADFFATRTKNAESRVDTARVERLIDERNEARRAKNFQKADEIRDRLKEMDIELEDRPDGTVWKYSP